MIDYRKEKLTSTLPLLLRMFGTKVGSPLPCGSCFDAFLHLAIETRSSTILEMENIKTYSVFDIL